MAEEATNGKIGISDVLAGLSTQPAAHAPKREPIYGPNPGTLYGGKDQAEIESRLADSLRIKLGQALHPVCQIMDEAAGHGLQIGFAVNKGPSGKHIVAPIDVIKHL